MLLFLNDIAGSEVLVILIFILIFFGSKSIPGIAKTFGRTMYQIKQASSDFQNEIKKSGVDIKKDLNLSSIIRETTEEIQRPLDQVMVEMDDIVSYTPPRPAAISNAVPPENITPTVDQAKEETTTEEIQPITDKLEKGN